ncbi:MAG: hypothetical protein ACI3YH_03345, partial [Eubacteriales bacterium]
LNNFLFFLVHIILAHTFWKDFFTFFFFIEEEDMVFQEGSRGRLVNRKTRSALPTLQRVEKVFQKIERRVKPYRRRSFRSCRIATATLLIELSTHFLG